MNLNCLSQIVSAKVITWNTLLDEIMRGWERKAKSNLTYSNMLLKGRQTE